MCLGIPGRVVERVEGFGEHLALVTVAGVPRRVTVEKFEEGAFDVGAFDEGSWVVIHMGFALEVVDETAPREAQEGPEMLGRTDPDGPGVVDGRRSPENDTN